MKQEKRRDFYLSNDAPTHHFLMFGAVCTALLIAIVYFFAWALYDVPL